MGIVNLISKLFENVISRIMTAFGFSFVSYKGFDLGIQQLKNGVSGMIGSLPADVMQLVYLSGIGQGLGYVVGALSFIAAIWAMKRFTLLGAA